MTCIYKTYMGGMNFSMATKHFNFFAKVIPAAMTRTIPANLKTSSWRLLVMELLGSSWVKVENSLMCMYDLSCIIYKTTWVFKLQCLEVSAKHVVDGAKKTQRLLRRYGHLTVFTLGCNFFCKFNPWKDQKK